MASLSPNARALITAGRRALRATAADRERVESALRARLGADALPSDAPTVPVAPRGGWQLLAKAGAATCLVGGALVAALTARVGTPTVSRVDPPPAAGQTTASATTESLDQPAPRADKVEAAPVPAPASPPHDAAPQRRRDRLAQEVALLTHATTALRGGRAQEALRVLETHQRRFPTGMLAEERRTAMAQALCRLGRVAAGRAQLSRLPPNSPAARGAEEVCSAPATREPVAPDR
jgi:hypothetical protein